ncbi:MAG TPA: flagellar hook-associated protein FlgK [Actinomycetes bacterium]|nr:flagellar hook-associated protein FlgK [Actinomycetes bacterium]
MSTFGSLSTALSALYAQQRGLDVTGQNIANANTEGYSRQRVDLKSVGAPTVPAIWATYEGAGGGVTVSDVQRLRDMFLESRAHTEHGRLSYLQSMSTTLANVEQTLGEPGETGLAAQLGEFWGYWHDVANNPGDLAARGQLLQQAGTITTTFHNAQRALAAQWNAAREQVGTIADEVTATAARVAELNAAIARATQAGTPSNELADQRDLLAMRLADLVGSTTKASTDGQVDVYLGGTALVRGATSNGLTVKGPGDFDSAGGAKVSLEWANGGYDAAVTLGKAGALLESVNVAIPGYLADLDGVAKQLVEDVNTVHAAGYDLTGNTGINFFDPTKLTADTIQVALSDPNQVAASAVPGGNLDGSNATKLADLGIGTTGPDATYRQLIVKLGVQAQTTNQRVDIQASTTTNLDSAREAQAGVSLDEEMVNMMSFQHAYAAAARVMTTIDQTLDVLINRTGLVGR